jgi:hypothetical protein
MNFFLANYKVFNKIFKIYLQMTVKLLILSFNQNIVIIFILFNFIDSSLSFKLDRIFTMESQFKKISSTEM